MKMYEIIDIVETVNPHLFPPLISAMRKAYATKRVAPAIWMEHWLAGTQPTGAKRIPIPEISQRYRDVYEWAKTESKSTSRNIADLALVLVNYLAVEVVAATFSPFQIKLIDMELPLRLSDEDVKLGTPLRDYTFYAMINDTTRLIYGND